MSQFGSPSGPHPPSNPFGQRPGVPYASPQAPAPSGENQLGMIALLCGVLSFFMGCPLSIAAIVMGWMGMKKEPKGMATAGFVIGIISLTLQLLVGCVVIGIYVAAAGAIVAVANAVGPGLQTMTALQQAQTKVQQHYAANQAYPTDAEGANLVAGLVDGWGNPITYRTDPDRDYVIASAGADGVAGTDDDVDFDSSLTVPGVIDDYSEVENPTARAIYQASDVIENAWNDDTELYPSDAEGQALVAAYVDEWGRPLTYRQTQGGDSYLVISLGADGLLDTPDDVNDESISEDYSDVSNPTERAIYQATDALETAWENSDLYPSDAEGTALVATFRDEWDRPLVYRQIDGGDSYLVISMGPDGMLDTGDDINDEDY